MGFGSRSLGAWPKLWFGGLGPRVPSPPRKLTPDSMGQSMHLKRSRLKSNFRPQQTHMKGTDRTPQPFLSFGEVFDDVGFKVLGLDPKNSTLSPHLETFVLFLACKPRQPRFAALFAAGTSISTRKVMAGLGSGFYFRVLGFRVSRV